MEDSGVPFFNMSNIRQYNNSRKEGTVAQGERTGSQVKWEKSGSLPNHIALHNMIR